MEVTNSIFQLARDQAKAFKQRSKDDNFVVDDLLKNNLKKKF